MKSIFNRSNKKEISNYNNLDHENIKILIRESEAPVDNLNSKEKDISQIDLKLVKSDSQSKWTKEYTYPPDRNLLKFKLKGIIQLSSNKSCIGSDKIKWVRMPDQRSVPWYLKPVRNFCIVSATYLLLHNYQQVLKPLNNQYIYNSKLSLK